MSPVARALQRCLERRSLVLVFVGAVLFAGSGSVLFAARDSTGVEAASALPRSDPPWRGTGVVHARLLGANGEPSNREEWLNRRTGETRAVEHGRFAQSPSDRITVSNGTRIVSWETGRSGVYIAEVFDPRDPWLENSSLLLRAWRALEAGRAHIIGSQDVDGTAALRVQLHRIGSGGDAPADLRSFVDVDEQTFLPLRLVVSTGGRTSTLRLELKHLAESAVPADLFRPTTRPWTIRDRRLRYRELASKVPFPVYALGERYRTLRYGASTLAELRGAPARGIASGPSLYLAYVEDDPYEDDATIQLIERAATDQARRWFAELKRERKLQNLRIAGRIRPVLLAGPNAAFRFYVLFPRTLVQGRTAGSEAEVRAMLARLQRAR